MTDGLNGCTPLVSEDSHNFYFYHDGDSKYLKSDLVRGSILTKITPNEYDQRT
jgi:hypothetical protein